jgi:hypothetical protein
MAEAATHRRRKSTNFFQSFLARCAFVARVLQPRGPRPLPPPGACFDLHGTNAVQGARTSRRRRRTWRS